jgi:site-specific DNA-adenine methylase
MFNWLGNKLKYLDVIKPFADKFTTIVDPMMGSGNLLVALGKQSIGNDIIPLMPRLYNEWGFFRKDKESFIFILNQYNKFQAKEDYYKFRAAWNKKYLSKEISDYFLIETFMLLKMCSNSMVRFNSKGEFNQGFRGTTGEFFKDSQIDKFVTELGEMKVKGTFCNKDVLDFLSTTTFDFSNSLFIFDPPYLLEESYVYSDAFDKDREGKIFDFIVKNNINFVYFNFINRDGKIHDQLDAFIKDNHYVTILLKSKTATGQGRTNTKEIKEIMISTFKTLLVPGPEIFFI